MITKEVPHFCFLKPVELSEKFEYEVMRSRAIEAGDNNPRKHTHAGHPDGAGMIIEKNWVETYWDSINKDMKDILEELK